MITSIVFLSVGSRCFPHSVIFKRVLNKNVCEPLSMLKCLAVLLLTVAASEEAQNILNRVVS